ncbi:Protein app1 [Spathaspora sp. JA1]|nr:Protein app1 [Spathaspora sp. JA1]
MEKIDLSTNARSVQSAYDKVVRGDDPSVSYVVYSVNPAPTLSLLTTGNGPLPEFFEQFEEGQIQFGVVRVTVPGSDVSKNILVGWCPDSAPAKGRLSFASNFAEVGKVLSSHIQITARDTDDLDEVEFLERVGAAAGARYSGSPGIAPVRKSPVVSKPAVVSKPPVKAAKPSYVPKSTGYVPKSTGKPVVAAPVKPKPKLDDGWGDAKDVEERDFSQNPLQDVASAYKPTKVDIVELRKNKSDTISSTPKPTGLSDDGRLFSLPKPKVGHSVADRYKTAATADATSTASFGAKPHSFNDDRKDRVVGGLSRNFAAEGGKTPAQIWAEKRGQYKTVASETESGEQQSEPTHEHTHDLVEQFEKKAVIEEEHEPTPRRAIPEPEPVAEPEPEEEEEEQQEEEEEEEEEPTPALPSRTKEEPAPVLPSRTKEEPTPALPSRNQAKPSITAVAEYDYEKDEDNEIGFTEGETIVDIEFTDEEWWTGRNAKGEVGLFPSAYVKLNEDEEPQAKEPEVKEPVREPVREPVATPSAAPSKSATAEYDYEKDEDNEIGFKEGDLIVEIEFVDEDWWSGKHKSTGAVGLFPSNYVRLNE